VRTTEILRAWGRLLNGYRPALSIEITKECPLSCPGCYAYQPDHLHGPPLTSLANSTGDELVRGILKLIERNRPVVVYLVGGEPLVRFRELNVLLPRIANGDIDVRVVTSAVRPIPKEWASLRRLGIVVSIDGLQPEHDARRKPATYERILKHIEGHHITVHCTVTSQMLRREGYLDEFLTFWSDRAEVGSIQISFFTPQVGETSVEILTPEMREKAVADLGRLHPHFPKLRFNPKLKEAFLTPPRNPSQCLFARTTKTFSADLQTVVEPCQFGGTPNCSECGCLASIGLHAISKHRLTVGISVSSLFEASDRVGRSVRQIRERMFSPLETDSKTAFSSR
jgi:MoaA/NifB/PqqE/SkfB family radical SAM enzyme